MPHCSRKGCNKEFSEGDVTPCIHHPGAPVFHEGLKSWSCCSDVNKPVMEFDQFMAIPGCTEAETHSIAPQAEVVKPQPVASPVTAVKSAEGKETFSSAIALPPTGADATTPAASVPEEEDDLTATIEPGTRCRRRGCGVAFVSDEVNRREGGEGAICTYHPGLPIFWEGSKGYLCCKRRVLEFDEFLKIPGCKQGRHLFSAPKSEPEDEELTTCRMDHYQTPGDVHVSIFAKQVDKARSTVKFEENKALLDLRLPASKRFLRSLDLFGPIDPEQSTYQIMSTKVELVLKKKTARSWTLLEKTDLDLGGYNLTFGVGGGTGTVGAKWVDLDESNQTR